VLSYRFDSVMLPRAVGERGQEPELVPYASYMRDELQCTLWCADSGSMWLTS
jgi:hypothetical protein